MTGGWRAVPEATAEQFGTDASGPAPGEGRSSGISVQQHLDAESRPVPAVLRQQSPTFLGTELVPYERYTSAEFFRLEVEQMWPRVWQMACNEAHIPKVGDSVLYEIGGQSLIVVRTEPDRIRAFHNVCLHRARRLRDCDGSIGELRCRYHGFGWNLDGSLKRFPSPWDFPQVDPTRWNLPEARVETWDTWVFINLDLGAPPLIDYLEVLPDHFARWPFKDKYIAAHVAKRVDCNWKTGVDAFVDSFHVDASHPQFLATTGGQDTQYDVYGPNVNRMITPLVVRGTRVKGELDEQSIAQRSDPNLIVPPGRKAREVVAEQSRSAFAALTGQNFNQFTDCEMVDAIEYFVFPNFLPWGGFGTPIVYRFRPDGLKVQSCVMETMLLLPRPAGEVPDPAPIHWLNEDETFVDAAELGGLGVILDQDLQNMPKVQEGMNSPAVTGATLGCYQEIRTRHLHNTLDRYVQHCPADGGRDDEGARSLVSPAIVCR
jgi:phenylpropionate dioxygenase-like ring-hydroxylating dioxygenase large terminal subunit